MRAVLLQDLLSFGRYLRNFPAQERRQKAEQGLEAVQKADSWRIRLGRAHPELGDGTLAGFCEPRSLGLAARFDDAEFADCLISALEAIVEFRKREQD